MQDHTILNNTCLEHFTDAGNGILTHLYHTMSDPFQTRKFHRRCWVTRIGHEPDELLLIGLIKGLVAGNNPLREQALKFRLIPWALIYGITYRPNKKRE